MPSSIAVQSSLPSSHAARRALRGLENTTPSLFSPSKLKVRTSNSPSEVCARRRLFLLASPPLNGRRASSSCLGVAGRDRRSRSQPRPRCPGSAASRSTFLPTSWSAPREPAAESSLLGRSRPRTSARRPSRRSMCGRACTSRAAARARTGAGSRLAAWWPARPFKFLLHSAAAKRAQSAD